MIYKTYYNSPIGKLMLAALDGKLIGLWLENQKHYGAYIKEEMQINDDIQIFRQAKKWLDKYFRGEKPSIKELELGAKRK